MDRRSESIYQGTPLVGIGYMAWIIHATNLDRGPDVKPARVSKIEITHDGVYYLLRNEDANCTYTMCSDDVFGDRDSAYMAALGRMSELCHHQLEQSEKAIDAEKSKLEGLLKIRERINAMTMSMPWRDN